MNVQIISGFLVLFSFIFGQTQFLRQDLFAIEDISIRKRSTMLVFNYFSVLISVEFLFLVFGLLFTSTLYNKNHQSKTTSNHIAAFRVQVPAASFIRLLIIKVAFLFKQLEWLDYLFTTKVLECVCLIAFSRTCTFKLTPTSL